jgi:hypothetical protein
MTKVMHPSRAPFFYAVLLLSSVFSVSVFAAENESPICGVESAPLEQCLVPVDEVNDSIKTEIDRLISELIEGSKRGTIGYADGGTIGIIERGTIGIIECVDSNGNPFTATVDSNGNALMSLTPAQMQNFDSCYLESQQYR